MLIAHCAPKRLFSSATLAAIQDSAAPPGVRGLFHSAVHSNPRRCASETRDAWNRAVSVCDARLLAEQEQGQPTSCLQRLFTRCRCTLLVLLLLTLFFSFYYYCYYHYFGPPPPFFFFLLFFQVLFFFLGKIKVFSSSFSFSSVFFFFQSQVSFFNSDLKSKHQKWPTSTRTIFDSSSKSKPFPLLRAFSSPSSIITAAKAAKKKKKSSSSSENSGGHHFDDLSSRLARPAHIWNSTRGNMLQFVS